MREKVKLIAIGILGAAGASLLTGFLVRRHYLEKMNEELEESYQEYKKINDEAQSLLKLATYEIHEMRYALKCMVDEMQYDTIMAQIEYKFGEYAKDHPETDVSHLRENVEQYVESHNKTIKRQAEKIPELSTEEKPIRDDWIDIVKTCGYLKVDDDLTDPLSQIGDEIAKAHRRRQAMREAAERMMAEEEYPYEEVGAERLAPNGDILDEAYDPSEDYEDEPLEKDDFDEMEEIAKAEFEQASKPEPDPMPYIISEYQFVEDPDRFQHEQCSIEYFALDDILLDEDETVMDQEIVGLDNLKEFERTDKPSIFIRNEKLGIDYEILYNEGSYRVNILGEPEGETIRKRIWRSWEKE